MMKIYTIEEILYKLEMCMEYKKPFSHIRFGDGGIKFIHSLLYRDIPEMGVIVNKEGIPMKKIKEVYGLWSYYANQADFIDTAEVYFNGKFWERRMSKKTIYRMKMWKELYKESKIENENYCNPESNYLMVTKIMGNKTLLDVIRGKKIAIITARDEVKDVLNESDVHIYKIVKQYQNHYNNSFRMVIAAIESYANNYDCWLVAAGELGRIYTGSIKENGGRAVDIGFVADFWVGDEINKRLHPFLIRSKENPLELKLTSKGKKYEEFI